MKKKLIHLQEFNYIEDKNVKFILFQFENAINNIWCIYSEEKGFSQIRQLQRNVNNVPERSWEKINIEMGHVKLRHGTEQARLQLKNEISDFVKNVLLKLDFNIKGECVW